MKEQVDSMPESATAPEQCLKLVSIYVPEDHPLLQLKRALDWEAIRAVMVKHWGKAGKNVDGGPGLPWPVDLYVPLVVLLLVKVYHSRQMEEYLRENVVARLFLGMEHQLEAHIRDHANIARAVEALGAEGIAEVNQLVVKQSQTLGFSSTEVLSSDTTVQEPAMGYPNEPGILKGLAERCERALRKLQKRGVEGAAEAIEKTKEIYRLVKEHHLFAKGKEAKDELLGGMMTCTRELMGQAEQIIKQLGELCGRVVASATGKLKEMGEVAALLLPQIEQWIKTGMVAKGKIIHAGLREARAIVKRYGGKKVRFGYKWLIHRLKGGYIFGRRVEATADERQMPLESLKDYREVFGQEQTPKMSVYDRGGSTPKTIQKLREEGVSKVGIPPRGKAAWPVDVEDQMKVKSERGKTEGSIGTLKSKKYGLSHRQERTTETQSAAGQRSICSLNLNLLMRDLSRAAKAAEASQA